MEDSVLHVLSNYEMMKYTDMPPARMRHKSPCRAAIGRLAPKEQASVICYQLLCLHSSYFLYFNAKVEKP